MTEIPTRCPKCGKFLCVNRREAFCLFHVIYRLTNSEVHRLVIRQAKEQGTWKKTTGRPRRKLAVQIASNLDKTPISETKSLCEWLRDERCNVGKDTLLSRLKRGWSLAEAVMTEKLSPGSYLGK